jgi:hypothetical protein
MASKPVPAPDKSSRFRFDVERWASRLVHLVAEPQDSRNWKAWRGELQEAISNALDTGALAPEDVTMAEAAPPPPYSAHSSTRQQPVSSDHYNVPPRRRTQMHKTRLPDGKQQKQLSQQQSKGV